MNMQVSVILAHPDPASFNHGIARVVLEALAPTSARVNFHDLCKEQFEPLLPAEEVAKDFTLPALVAAHCREIAEADLIIIIHPNWWGQPPAMLKGWIDRVIRPGVAYEFLEGDSGEGVPIGLLRAKLALVFNTSNTEVLREQQVFGDPLETIWKNCIFGLCGVAEVRRKTFAIVITSTEEQRRSWLAEVRQQVEEACAQLSESQ